ncbi:MAG: PTS sugar transporter subunit IIA [Candidatus Cloacimonetes bacterium]|nr:PTS sugar transporter subunit IIA [Candidatus Cloacimonadota bacterium]MCF7813126.1 PTS sugar transporter subunit IIA [Candidatus Cloacimonadota bacterium]MCF7867574.1 PTS sugar transporter subunit IIA [Candidatus Cloacimonadota bacterium]MCF7883032.1 PTS sugar transporter subunit IIA [Candidatus Cloacimonadota bacterium]
MWRKSINKNLIIINPDVSSKKELFEEMVNHVYNLDLVMNKKKFLNALLEREKMANTELIPGIALPHARTNATNKMFISIVILKKGLDYGNPDMGPVRIIFFFGCDEDHNKEYLQLLAKSNRILKMKGFQEKLLQSNKPEEIMELLTAFDDEIDESEEGRNYLLLFTLNIPDKTTEVMNSMVELGITNASIVDSTSMAKTLAYEMPIFAGLSYMAQGKSKRSSLIFAHIENRNLAKKLAKLLKENGIDLTKKGVGFLQTIKVEDIIGNFEEDIDL